MSTDHAGLRGRHLSDPVVSSICDQSLSLSAEDFDSLIKSLQLLRISQLRYVVQRFSIPASGNKSKLLGLVISIFQSLRHDPTLAEIHAEVNRLLAQQGDPFSNPLAVVPQLEVVDPDPNFLLPETPLFIQSDGPFLFGPFFAPPGQVCGRFSFTCAPPENPVNICFLFPEGIVHPFAFKADLNGFPLEVSIEDPYPNHIDITNILNSGMVKNFFDVKFIIAHSPMMICIREYQFLGLIPMAERICGRAVRLDETIFVISRRCIAHRPFDLMLFLSRGYATGVWKCPCCQRPIEMTDLILAPRTLPSQDLPMGLFQPGSADSFDNWEPF